ncbi:MAG TPA: cysteine protease [Rikenellaceae bacterium]|nr:MAG: cysteine protease [Bacteroidetes bacterium GWE2_40_15]HBZ25272.1 cysteine protease [Rikenellaceae bacterium]
MRNFSIILLSTLLFACGESLSYKMPDKGTIETAIEKGEFTEASKMVRLYLACDTLTPRERYEMSFLLEWMDRVKDDFDQTDSSVIAYIKKHYPQATTEQISEWEKRNALENKVIDGQKRYFSLAGRNLFRIDSLAEKHFQYKEGEKPDSLTRLLSKLIPQLVNEAKTKKGVFVNPVKMKIRYTLSVKPNEVPDGESVRVWMPYPRTDTKSHTDIQLLSTTQPLYIISPDSYAHKSIYMEGVAVKDEPLKFGFELIYTSFAQVHLFGAEDIKDYDISGEIYKEYTGESGQHIRFSDNIRSAVKEAIGEESNPYLKARKIYEWIDSNFPWASAREYSTIENIPEYVLKNRHGDCGQVSLLFITMARCAGVPAKWQSGWMMHPGNINLHDWAEVWFEGVGWVPVDQSFGRVKSSKGDDSAFYFFTKGLDPYRLIVNDNISGEFFPAKIYPRSETVDFQRGEVEWRGENLYFGRWRYKMEVEYIK